MVIDLYATGETELERMFNLIQMGDFISYYLAILNDVNPTPVEAIENLKTELAKVVINP
jgi:glucose/mannose-6-phosphate isomerase